MKRKKPFTTSYSAYSTFKKCKLQYKFKYVLRFEEPESHALIEGTRVHELAEQYVLGNIQGIPDELRMFNKAFNELRDMKCDVEVDLSVTKKWEWTTYDDWNNVYCRARGDLLYYKSDTVVKMIDYKTGGVYPEHETQGKLYGALVFAHYDVKKIEIENWYLQTGEKHHNKIYYLKDWKGLMSFWTKEFNKMEACKDFKAEPGNHCRWCTFSKSNSGICDHG